MAADVYKFALLVLRMHTGAQHHRNAARLPVTTWGPLRELVDRSLSGLPANRPLITEWIGPLQAAAGVAPGSPVPALVPRDQMRLIGRTVPGPPVRPEASGPSRNSASGPSLLPAGPLTDFVIRVLRRLLLRRPANPSISKLVFTLAGLCAALGGRVPVGDCCGDGSRTHEPHGWRRALYLLRATGLRRFRVGDHRTEVNR